MEKKASVENYPNLNTSFTELPSPNKLDGHRYRIDCEFMGGVCTICKKANNDELEAKRRRVESIVASRTSKDFDIDLYIKLEMEKIRWKELEELGHRERIDCNFVDNRCTICDLREHYVRGMLVL